MFTYNSLTIGPLYPKQIKTLEFPYSDINIIEVSSTCGCSNVHDSKEGSKVKVTYTAQAIPVHLIDRASISTEKFIKVKYYVNDPTKEEELTLSFKATIINNANRKQ